MTDQQEFDALLRRAVQRDVEANAAPSGMVARLLVDARATGESTPRRQPRARVLAPFLVTAAILVIAIAGIVIGLLTDHSSSPAPVASSPTAAAPSIAAPSIAATPAPTVAPTSAAQPTSTAAAGSHRPVECSASTLSIAAENGQQVMHLYSVAVHFTNISNSACTIQGYPGVALLDAQGTQLVQALREAAGIRGGLPASPPDGSGTSSEAPPSITLQPTQEATAVLEGPTTAGPDGTFCPEISGLLVTAPDETTSTKIAIAVPDCGGHQSAVIHPVVAGSTGRSIPGTSGSLPECVTNGLAFSLKSLQGAAGTGYFAGYLTNVGADACVVYGTPTLTPLDSNGKTIPQQVVSSTNVPTAGGGTSSSTDERGVTLKPGDRAEFLITASSVVPQPGCPTEVTAASLQVTPPGQTASLTADGPTSACGLTVGPLVPAV